MTILWCSSLIFINIAHGPSFQNRGMIMSNEGGRPNVCDKMRYINPQEDKIMKKIAQWQVGKIIITKSDLPNEKCI